SVFAPTEAMSLSEFLSPDSLPGMNRDPAVQSCGGRMWCGSVTPQVQGGGLRLANLPRVFFENLRPLRTRYGDGLLVAAVLGAVISAAVRPLLLVTTVSYV